MTGTKTNHPKEHETKMLAVDRRAHIMKVLGKQPSVTVATLSDDLHVTSATVRSDLVHLEQEGKLKRTHGGAVAVGQAKVLAAYTEKKASKQAEKARIGRCAAGFIDDGDTIFMDGGSTTLGLMEALGDKKGLTIVTCDLFIAEFAEKNLSTSTVVVVGGSIRPEYRYTYGRLSRACFDLLHMDKAFMATSAYLPGQGFMVDFDPLASTKEQALRSSNIAYMLMDASKIGRSGFIRFSTMSDYAAVIVDEDPDGQLSADIERSSPGTRLCIVRSDGSIV